MKTKVLFLLSAGCLIAFAAWLVRVPNPVQADDVPEKYRDTVRKGLEYLVKNQHNDGHWEGDAGKHPVAMTGLVGLTLLMEGGNKHPNRLGETIGKVKIAANIRKAADWLMDQSQAKRDGLIFSDHPSETARYMEGHGLATLFLAGACTLETDEMQRKKLTDVLTRAVKYIVRAQSTQSGWYHTSKVEGHDFDTISATAIQIQALQAAENAGIPVPDGAMNDGREYLRKVLHKLDEKAHLAKNRSKPSDIAAALACISSSGFFGKPPDESSKKWLKYCQSEIPMGREIKFGRDELSHYYYSQAVFNFGGDWNSYRTALFDHLQASQNKDGSWPAGDGIGVGPVYATAVWSVVFQLDKLSHPSRARDRPIVTTSRRLGPLPGLRLAMNRVEKAQVTTLIFQ